MLSKLILLPKLACALTTASFRTFTIPLEKLLDQAEKPKGCSREVKFHISVNGLPEAEVMKLTRSMEVCLTIDRLAEMIDRLSSVMCYFHIGLAFEAVAKFNMELNEDFWEIVFPYAKALVMSVNRETAGEMATVLISLSKLLIQDDELWEAAQKKLINENLLRYVKISKLPSLFYAFAYNQKGKKETIEKIENVMLRNIKYYVGATDPEFPTLFKNAYDLLGKEVPAQIQEIIDEKYYPPMPLPDL